MIRKILSVGVAIIMSLGLFAGCGGNKYDAVILEDFDADFNDEFLKTTFGVENEPENLDEWWSDNNDGWWNYDFDGKKLIHTQTLIIKDQGEADIAFDYFPSDFDFEKDMLLFCFFAESSQWIESPSSYKIENMRIEGSTLKFIIKIKARESSAQGRSNQRCKIIKMKKLAITAAQFERRYRA